MWKHFILICLFGLCLAVNSENSFKLSSDFEVNSNNFGDNAERDDTLSRYLVERIENIERLAKKEHENNLILKERVLQLEARDRLREDQLAEVQKRCEHLGSTFEQEMIGARTHKAATTINRNASKGIHFDGAGFKQLVVSHESNYGSNRSMMKTRHTRVLGSGGYRILTPVTEEPVAFSATLQNHMLLTGVSQVIIFEYVITNVGNGYNPHAGDFRAPVAGIYVFSVSLMPYHSTTTGDYVIRRNGAMVSKMYLRGDIGSHTIVLELNKFDDVVVTSQEAKDENLFGHGQSIFSGFLLQKTYPDISIVGRK